MFGAQPRATQIDPDDAVEVIDGRVGDGREMNDARVGDELVDPTERTDAGFDHADHLCFVAHVDWVADGVAADLGRCNVGGIAVNVRAEHVGTLVGEPLRDGEADSRSSTRHYGGLIGQVWMRHPATANAETRSVTCRPCSRIAPNITRPNPGVSSERLMACTPRSRRIHLTVSDASNAAAPSPRPKRP